MWKVNFAISQTTRMLLKKKWMLIKQIQSHAVRGRYEAATQAKNPVCVVMKREDEMSRYDP